MVALYFAPLGKSPEGPQGVERLEDSRSELTSSTHSTSADVRSWSAHSAKARGRGTSLVAFFLKGRLLVQVPMDATMWIPLVRAIFMISLTSLCLLTR